MSEERLAGIIGRIPWRKVLYFAGIVLGSALLLQQAWQGYVALQQAQACVMRPGFLLGALGLYVVAYFVQMTAWALIMRYLSAPLSPQAVVNGYALSFLPRYIPGSVWGYLSRNEWLAQTHDIHYGISTTASIIEAALLLLTAGMLGALIWLPSVISMPALGLAIVAAGIAATWVVWAITPRLAGRIRGAQVEIKVNRGETLWLWGLTGVLYVGFWMLQGGALLTIARTLCGGLTLDLASATAAFALAWAVGFLVVFVPAGMGVREWTLNALLVAFAALQPGQATLIALVARFGLIVAELLVLLIGLRQHTQKWQGRGRWFAHDRK